MTTDWKTDGPVESMEIAIIGMSGRFPGAENLDQFWQNLRDGVESIRQFTDEELKSFGVSPESLGDPNFVKAGAILENIDRFDATFFGYSPREAETLDPQQRIFLECAWHAMEDAGYSPKAHQNLVGVFAGTSLSTYLIYNLLANEATSQETFQAMIGNDKDFLSTRISYELNLRGPSLDVQTACSTSLVAVHLACQSLLTYQCDMALAGGISVQVPQCTGYYYLPGGISSPDGHCRAFDAEAQGTVFGSGVGIVVLKRLADALSDRDTIHAVIKGSALNNDGSSKLGYAAPSIEGQAQAIAVAQIVAGTNAETITYVETHGTGTALGDPAEIAALTKAFRASTDKNNFCAIGSVKTNIGHLDAAAGIAGLIKTALALEHKQLPASLHFKQANPQIDFASSPFYVNSRLQEWNSTGSKLRAGVSSFGVGGTNAHLILEQAPGREPSSTSKEYQLIVISAKSGPALEAASRNLVQHLRKGEQEQLADVAYTLQVGRRRMSHRRMVVCRDVTEATRLLELNEPHRIMTTYEEAEGRPVVFMFPGQGSQYVNMGRGLYRSEEEFAKQVGWCAEALRDQLGFDLRRVLYPPEGKEREAEEELNQTMITQPALFVVEYAMAKQLEKWGIKADAMIGHSLGEYVAACLAGVMSIEDALWLVGNRGKMMQEAKGGGMVAVMMSEAEAMERIKGSELCIGAVNGGQQVVISGEEKAIEELIDALRKEGKESKKLKTKQAYHSWMMEKVAARYVEEVRKVGLRRGGIKYISNVTGKMVSGEETDPRYWGRQMRECVRFGAGIEELMRNPGVILLEVGPAESLSRLARQSAARTANQVIISTMRNQNEFHHDSEHLTTAIGKLWMAGVEIDWKGYYEGEMRRRVKLPTYPFERQRYWVEASGGMDRRSRSKAIGKREDVSKWFYVPGWQRKELPRNAERGGAVGEKKEKYIVFAGSSNVSRKLIDRMRSEAWDVIRINPGDGYRKVTENEYEIRTVEKNDYVELVKDLISREDGMVHIVHLWSLDGKGDLQKETIQEEQFRREQQRGFYSLLHLAHALTRLNISNPIAIDVICNNLHQIGGEEKCSPEKSTLLAFCKGIPQETRNISCRSIDIIPPQPETKEEARGIDRLMTEIESDSQDVVIAYRDSRRWIQSFEPLLLERGARPIRPLRVRGVYLITGGLGGVGLLVAEYLARTVQARLVLVGRSFFPKRSDWAEWLRSHNDDDEISVKIRKLQAIEAAGAEIVIESIDVTDENRMQSLIKSTLQQFGALHGVLHAAGVTSGPSVFNPFTEIDAAEAELQFQPKAYGLYVLERVLKNIDIDFCLLFSSNASVLGGLGLLAYSAANTFMDAFASSRNGANQAHHSASWISANWDPWPKEIKKYTDYQTGIDQYAMTAEESIEAFSSVVMSASEGQVIVSTGDLRGRLDLWINHKALKVDPRSMEELSTYPRLNIASIYVAPRNNAEATIASIWQQMLGIEPIGVHDNFFELGGHSLLATRMMTHVHDALQVELPLRDLFETPTIAGLAASVERLLGNVKEERVFAQLLSKIEQLSDEEAASLLLN